MEIGFLDLFSLLYVRADTVFIVFNQGVTITYMKQDYESTDNDPNSIIEIINCTDSGKKSIKQKVEENRFLDRMDFKWRQYHWTGMN
jgi:hypothetical protein